MDKLRIMEYIAVVNNIIIGLAASITTFVAVRGLNSWQREHTWKDNSEVARALMRATYKLRNQLHYARSPCVFPSELPKDYSPNSGDKTAQSEAEALSHVLHTAGNTLLMLYKNLRYKFLKQKLFGVLL
ncbi:MAG: hypothetical protein OXD32_08670 [Endozoicomonadaceae bacterium]|nr:hypothetical protein [Endozoicomonadaceae bacterium]MCY4328696.1 hypothetical protein [Endozoicomonadaceae bacterium]